MTKCLLKLALTCLLSAAVLGVAASPVFAQYRPLTPKGTSTATKGENYHAEFAVNFWGSDPGFFVTANGLGISGTQIDGQGTLGLMRKELIDFRAVLRPAKKHKIRFEYLPSEYLSTATLNATIVFRGQTYPVSAQVDSTLSWKTYRFGYEYDFVYTPVGYVGVLVEAKVVQARLQIDSAFGSQAAEAQAPIPSIGVTGRGYIAPGLSITGEYSYFQMPSFIAKNIKGSYTEFDVYATYNITNNVGAQAGFRKIDVHVDVDPVFGQSLQSGTYFGGVVRF